MRLKHYLKLLTGKIKVIKPAKITLSNIKAVIQSWMRKKRRKLGGFDLPDHMYEQIIWRRTQVISISPICWEIGYCKVCGCDILGKTMEDRACEAESPCYPAMMTEENWKKFKQLNNIKLFE